MSRNQKVIVDWQWLESQIFLGEESKIHFPHISIDITKGCNMRCEYCSHLSPLMRGHFLTEELVSSLEKWGKRLQPKRIAILGGEPLLHPDFEEIVLSAHQYWPNSEIVVVTNGILIEKIKNSFLEKIHEIGRVRFDISQHTESLEWMQKYEEMKSRFTKHETPFSLRKSYSQWMTTYKQTVEGRYVPYTSLPQKAWEGCWGRSFYKIHEGNLWYCTRLVSAFLAVKEGLFGEEWQHILSHQPMTPNNTQEEILAYLKQDALPECSMCPEEIVFVESRQMASL